MSEDGARQWTYTRDREGHLRARHTEVMARDTHGGAGSWRGTRDEFVRKVLVFSVTEKLLPSRPTNADEVKIPKVEHSRF